MLQELEHAHFLSRQLVPYGRAGRVAVRPGAAVDQMQGASSQRRGPVLFLAVAAVEVQVALEAAVPAVQSSGQGGAFHLNVHPVRSGYEFMRQTSWSKHGCRVSERAPQLLAQVLDVPPLALKKGLSGQVDVIDGQLRLVKEPLDHKQRTFQRWVDFISKETLPLFS